MGVKHIDGTLSFGSYYMFMSDTKAPMAPTSISQLNGLAMTALDLVGVESIHE